jgi:hypothetical protein
MDREHNKEQGGRRSGEIDNKIINGIQEIYISGVQ